MLSLTFIAVSRKKIRQNRWKLAAILWLSGALYIVALVKLRLAGVCDYVCEFMAMLVCDYACLWLCLNTWNVWLAPEDFSGLCFQSNLLGTHLEECLLITVPKSISARSSCHGWSSFSLLLCTWLSFHAAQSVKQPESTTWCRLV